nr:hypothetical protein [Tanacetum cinerariifolium]
MDMTIDQQVALDKALVPHASILRIGKINFPLRSDITSKESTLQLVYDVLQLTLFYKAFLATTYTFDELQFEEEILAFLRFLGHSREIRKLIDTSYIKLSIRTPRKAMRCTIPGAAPPKTKASVRKTKSSSDATITPLTTAATKRSLQQTHISQASGSGTDEGTGILPGFLDVPTDEEISWKSSDEDDHDEVDKRSDDQEEDDDQDDDDQEEGNDDDQDTDNDSDDFVHPKLSIHEEEAKDEESFDLIVQTPENSNNESNDDASLGLNVGGKEGQDAEDDDEELYRDVNIILEGRDVQMTDVHTTQEFEDTHVTLTLVNPDGQQQSSSVSSQFVTSMLNPNPDAGIDSLFETTPRTLEDNFSEFVQTNQFAGAVSSIPEIVERCMDQRMNEAVKVAVQIQSDRLKDKAQANNEEFLKNLDENIQKIIKEQVKEQVKMKNPSLDQTGGLRDEENEKSQSQQALQRRRQPTGKSTQGSKSHHKTASESAPAEEPMQTT